MTKLLRILNDFINNRDLAEYAETMSTLILSYVKTEEYNSLNQEERNRIVDAVIEGRMFVSRIKEETERIEYLTEILRKIN